MKTESLPFVLLTLALALLAACSGGDDKAGDATELRTAEAPAIWAVGQAESFESLIAATGTVFVGRVGPQLTERPTLTPAGGESRLKPSIPVTSFEVAVVEAISGTLAAGDTVVMNQPYGVVQQSDGPVLVFLEGDGPLETGQSFLFFASERPDGTFTVAPYGRYEVDDDSGFAALEGWGDTGVARALGSMTVSEADARIGGGE